MIWTAMFCRRCAYDLRGQQTPRCPECGIEFDFDDPATFFTQTPTRARRLLRWYRRRQKLWTKWLTVGMLASMLIGLGTLPRPGLDYSFRRMAYLRAFVSGWRFEHQENPDARVDIRALAKDWSAPNLSPRTERGALWGKSTARHFLQVGPVLLPLAIAYVVLLSVLYPSRCRRARIVAIVSLVLMLISCVYSNEIPDALWPGSYAYLDDFVFVGDLRDEGPIPLDERIVAYDLCSFQGDRRRYVVFGDTHDALLDPDEAERLFRKHGIPLPPTE